MKKFNQSTASHDLLGLPTGKLDLVKNTHWHSLNTHIIYFLACTLEIAILKTVLTPIEKDGSLQQS